MARRTEATWQEVVHLVAAFEAVQAGFARSKHAEARTSALHLAQGLETGRAAIAAGRDGQWPPGLVAGLRQGGRELPYLLLLLPDDERPAAVAAISEAGGVWLADLITGTSRKAKAILKRGQITSEDEYHCVRARIDQLEQQGAPAEDRQPYSALVDAYSIASGPRDRAG